MTTATRRLRGRCLCGALAYEVDDAFLYAMNCHCSQCRLTTGAAFKPLAGIESRRLTLTAEDDAVLRYGDDGPAGFHNVNCRRCGSFLYAVVAAGATVHVAMGTLVDAPSIRPGMHIFVGSKAPWHEITDDLPQHEGFPPG